MWEPSWSAAADSERHEKGSRWDASSVHRAAESAGALHRIDAFRGSKPFRHGRSTTESSHDYPSNFVQFPLSRRTWAPALRRTNLIFNPAGAERITGTGHLLYGDFGNPVRLQAPHLPEDERQIWLLHS
ncbi:MAG: hypothetical protein QM784_21300 [Polyangiaceae bacterium]